jgi:hypothetical protein
VILFLALSSVFEWLGLSERNGRLLLPLAALAMTVERFTSVSIDQGTREALAYLGETLVLAVACATILQIPLFKSLIVAFPEILLVLIAEVFALGNYRGLRWRELWRFRAVSGPGFVGTEAPR